MGVISAGIGIALNDVTFIGDPNASLQLTFDSAVGGVADSDSGFLDHIALFGSSTSGTSCDASPTVGGVINPDCKGINVGDLGNLSLVANRINLDFRTESGTTFMELAWPTAAAGESTGIDLHFRVVTSGTKTGLGFTDDFFADVTWWRIQNIKLQGSALRMWGSGVLNNKVVEVDSTTGLPTAAPYNGGVAVGMGMATTINAEFDLVASVASSDVANQNEQYKKFPGGGSGDDSGRFNGGLGNANHADNKSRVELENVSIQNLTMGFFNDLPLVFGSIDRTSGGNDKAPDFYIEAPMVPNDTGASGIATLFYANSPKANISIDRVQLGTSSSGSNVPFYAGQSAAKPAVSITGLRIQHLRIETNAN
jgi:hypothetical protein